MVAELVYVSCDNDICTVIFDIFVVNIYAYFAFIGIVKQM